MFSSRTDWNLVPNSLHQLLEEKRKKGQRVLDLTESNPTRCGFTYDPAILQALSTEQSLKYDPDPRGLLSARQTVAQYYNRQHVALDPSNIFLTAGTSEAYSHLFRLLCNPGESILVPKPSYPLFDYLCALNDVEARHYRLRYHDEWELDFESMEGAIDSTTRAIVLVHPNNPTGSFVSLKNREAILRIAAERRVALIVDEVFAEFQLEETQKFEGSFAAERSGLIFALNGISKWLGLPQLKLAWIAVSGDNASTREASNRLEVICDTFLSVSTPVQQALPEIFARGQNVTDQIRTRIRENYGMIRQSLQQSSLSVLRAEGGWNVIIRLPRIMSDEQWAMRLLADVNVLLYPGHFFEIEQDACVVVSLLPQKSVLAKGIHTLDEFVRSAQAPST